MSSFNKVVLIGRANVGKSTLFNRISSTVKSLTFDFPGTTRDFIKDIVDWQGKSFELIDSGGLIIKKTKDPIEAEVRKKVIELIESSDLIIFVGDAKTGLTQKDLEINKFLRRFKKNIIFVVNKVDNASLEENLYEFSKLGYKTFPISALHGKGIADLLNAVTDKLGNKTKEERMFKYKIALLGKPNTGKSSLMNLLLQQERSIVSDRAGTTREAVIENVKFYKENIRLTDTPGIRKKKGIKESLEKLMVKSAFRAVEDADIILMLIDSAQGKISDQELKLAFYSFEKGKAVILLLNKYDLLNEYSKSRLKSSMEEYRFFVDKLEILRISCKTGENIGKILPLIDKVWYRYSKHFSEEELNILFKEALLKRPLYHKTNLLRLNYAKQIKTAPIVIALKVNQPDWFGSSQLSFFENLLRKKYNIKSVPIKFILRKTQI